jgi:hypothetical protein
MSTSPGSTLNSKIGRRRSSLSVTSTILTPSPLGPSVKGPACRTNLAGGDILMSDEGSAPPSPGPDDDIMFPMHDDGPSTSA